MHTLFFDGGTRRADDVAAGSAVIYDGTIEVATVAKFIPRAETNNIAEYTGLIIGLEAALKMGIGEIQCYGDSELVVRQVTQQYQCRKPHLIPLRAKVWELGRRFKTITISETPKARKAGSPSEVMRRRNNNVRADELANEAMDLRVSIHLDEQPMVAGGDGWSSDEYGLVP